MLPPELKEELIHPPCTCVDPLANDQIEMHEIQVDREVTMSCTLRVTKDELELLRRAPDEDDDVAVAADYWQLRNRLCDEADAKFQGMSGGGEVTSEDYYHLVQRGGDRSLTVESLFDTM